MMHVFFCIIVSHFMFIFNPPLLETKEVLKRIQTWMTEMQLST